jgi:ABC-type multidrug transport system ATPase subunit
MESEEALGNSMEPAPALELHRIAKFYGRTAALKNISLCLGAERSLALLGPNGSGKTTLLKIIAGAIVPTLGGGTIFGTDIGERHPDRRTLVGLLAAESYLYDDLTSLENLRFVLVMAGKRPQPSDLMSALSVVSLETHANERVRNFSSGMRRRLSLARILLVQPRLLLLDEPYNSLDAVGMGLVDEIVRRQQHNGGATVLATHDVDRALALCDTVAVLERGALSQLGPAREYESRHAQHVG